LAGEFNIRSIPTLMIFREQVILFAQPGMLPPEAIDEILGKVRDLDMDDVRRQIEEEQAKENG
jgi:thioredoxin 1